LTGKVKYSLLKLKFYFFKKQFSKQTIGKFLLKLPIGKSILNWAMGIFALQQSKALRQQ